MQWRWDQGRTPYFNFANLEAASRVLLAHQGEYVTTGDPIRSDLAAATGLPYATPPSYTAWRNYARIYKACMIATSVDGKLQVTDLGTRLAGQGEPIDIDTYISLVVQRLSFPSPAFAGYTSIGAQVFPLCAVIRYLLGLAHDGADPAMSLDDVAGIIAGNHMRGDESIDAFQKLLAKPRTWVGDERRQVRELFKFVGQASFLSWTGSEIRLHVSPSDGEALEGLELVATPWAGTRLSDADAEVIRLGGSLSGAASYADVKHVDDADQAVFTEGKRVRKTHLRIERDSRLRKAYLANADDPAVCDMCGADTKSVYPWMNLVVDVHHLLPLASSAVQADGTVRLEDVVGLCPTCHRAVHGYYRQWLSGAGQDDFISREEAVAVYNAAKDTAEAGQ